MTELFERFAQPTFTTAALLSVFLFAACGTRVPGSSAGDIERPDANSRTLVAASNMLHLHFSSWAADGSPIGLEVDIVEEAARDLGARVTWVERPFSELLAAVENGKVDLAVATIGADEATTNSAARSIA